MIEKGLKNSVIAEKLQVDRRTVYNWRLRKEREGCNIQAFGETEGETEEDNR